MFFVVNRNKVANGAVAASARAFATREEAERWALRRCAKTGHYYNVTQLVSTVSPTFTPKIHSLGS